MVGKSNKDLMLVEETEEIESGDVTWRVIEGAVRPIDPKNEYLTKLLEREDEILRKKQLESVRQRYKTPECIYVERRIFGKLIKCLEKK